MGGIVREINIRFFTSVTVVIIHEVANFLYAKGENSD